MDKERERERESEGDSDSLVRPQKLGVSAPGGGACEYPNSVRGALERFQQKKGKIYPLSLPETKKFLDRATPKKRGSERERRREKKRKRERGERERERKREI